MACLRSRRRPADAARLSILAAVVSIGGCEAIFAGPLHENAGGESTSGPVLGTGGDELLTSSGDSDAVDDDTAAGEAEVDGGELFDLGNDTSGVPPPPPHNDGECCAAAPGIGCADPKVEACVCDVDPACCEKSWDELCALHVEQLGCGGCIGTTGTRDSVQDCCLAHEEPGCMDMDVAACVCASDPYCCMVGWDQLCADSVVELGCDDCIEPLGPVDFGCCAEHDEPGCADPAVMACVCEQDAFCCDNGWDVICVDEVEGFGCGECYPQGTTGDASLTSDSGGLATTNDGTDPGTSSSGT